LVVYADFALAKDVAANALGLATLHLTRVSRDACA
jgi:hypothetical protein